MPLCVFALVRQGTVPDIRYSLLSTPWDYPLNISRASLWINLYADNLQGVVLISLLCVLLVLYTHI